MVGFGTGVGSGFGSEARVRILEGIEVEFQDRNQGRDSGLGSGI
ncbi:hypothetical protein TIFTF001_027785 [Ficus carica]|uniref:Uncharacterized protein n=1 Tax=Ficus carica TaxID=3494 RepID=A0AA88DNT3_FICCA|nr:hypothetical protein TIFTF001_027785 [Ficus carica]